MRLCDITYSDNATYLYVQASWLDKAGKPCSTKMSTQKHGILEAVRIVMERREAGSGESYGLTPRAAWNLLKAHSGRSERT